MSTEQIINEALILSRTTPPPFRFRELVSDPQSFTPFFYHLLRLFKPKRILEWGPGQSTEVFLRSDSEVKIDTIEEWPKWANQYRQQILAKNSSWLDRLNIMLVEHTPGGGLAKEYINPDLGGNIYDIAFIDGGDRQNCFAFSHGVVRSGGIIMIHDTEIPDYFPDLCKYTSADKTKYVGDHTVGSKKTSIWVRL